MFFCKILMVNIIGLSSSNDNIFLNASIEAW